MVSARLWYTLAYDELQRELQGSAKQGERVDLTRLESNQVPWSYQQTADDLGISKATVVQAIKEYDDLKRKLEGNAERYSHPKAMSRCNIGWTQQETAQDLGISRPAVVKAIKIATAIEEHPKLEGERPRGNPNLLQCSKLDSKAS